MDIQAVNTENRSKTNRFLEDYWSYTLVVLRGGEQFELKNEEGLIAVDENGGIIGSLMYRMTGGVCEILAVCAVRQHEGIGTALIAAVEAIALNRGRSKLLVVTTNDNLNAIGFYQKRGFCLRALYRNAMDYVRAVKPFVPLIGENGIPLRDELEFEKTIS